MALKIPSFDCRAEDKRRRRSTLCKWLHPPPSQPPRPHQSWIYSRQTHQQLQRGKNALYNTSEGYAMHVNVWMERVFETEDARLSALLTIHLWLSYTILCIDGNAGWKGPHHCFPALLPFMCIIKISPIENTLLCPCCSLLYLHTVFHCRRCRKQMCFC